MSATSMVGNRVKGTDFWSRLQPRERWMVFGLTIAVILMVALILFVQRERRLAEVRQELGELRTAIATLRAEGANYQTKAKARDARFDKLATDAISFDTLLDTAERQTGVSATRQEESPAQSLADGLTRRDYKFDLRRVSLAKFSEYLGVLEGTKKGVVKTRGLLIRSLNAEEDALNATVEIATWERAAPEASPEGETQ